MPAQKRPLPVDLEDQQRNEPFPPQPNGNHHPSQNDVVQIEQQREKEEACEKEEDEKEDVEMKEPKHEEENDDEDEHDDDDDEEDEDEEEENDDEEEKQHGEDSGGTQSSSSEEDEKPEFVYVELPEIRKEVQCPICLGIIKKTRTVMECLHRFCRECIDKSMRMGNNECPACRTHCASRRSLRDDPNYDALIAALYPDIDKYEEEELAFHEEERTRNKQIQASIAQIFQRQSEALAKRRTMGKETSGPFLTRSLRNNRGVHSRRRWNSRGNEFPGLEENEEENDDRTGKDSSSNDERSTEPRQRRGRRRSGSRPSQPSTSADPEGGFNENDVEASRENRGFCTGLVWNTEMPAWGGGGARSHTRHGNASVGGNKSSRGTRLSKLVEYLKSFEEKQDELGIHLKLISLDGNSVQGLQQPYLCCQPSLSIKHLCEYVAHQTPLQAEEVEILLINGHHGCDDTRPSIPMDEPQILKGQDTLAGIKANLTTSRDSPILAYRRKGES